MSDSSQPSSHHSSWVLLETQDLRRLLGAQPANSDATPYSEFPGVVAQRKDASPGIVALGYGIEVHSVLALTTPVVLGQLSVEAISHALTMLLQAATQIALRNGCQWLRCLIAPADVQADDSASGLRAALFQQEFACCAEIGEWCCEYSQLPEIILQQVPVQSEMRCARIRVDQIRVTQTHEEIQRVLESILSASSDLPHLPRPIASDMMAQWMREGTQLMLLRVHSQFAGLCAYQVTPATFTTESTGSQLSVWLQYVGVVKEFRNQRCASRMIDAVVRDCLQEGLPIMMSVTADRTNVAAVRLYESLGFQLKSVHEVWTKNVSVR